MTLPTTEERGMLFSAPMVRALLDGSKTQTRRVMKPQPAFGCSYVMNANRSHALHFAGETWPENNVLPTLVPPTPRSKDHRLRCPYGKPGDRLWVKETWGAHFLWDGAPPREILNDGKSCVFYAADGAIRGGCVEGQRGKKWRPSIFMPRWASRITLELTDVRVERVQDISEDDAKAEGAWRGGGYEYDTLDGTEWRGRTYVGGFRELWDSINGPRGFGWKVNPFCWVLSFRKLDGAS